MTNSKIYLFSILIGLSISIKLGVAQNRIVINQNGYINITNGAQLVIDNPNTNAITVLGTGGNIVSEGELNVVKWNIGTNTGSYTVPFTTNSLVKIPLTVNLTSAGTGAAGAIVFSTYETATDSNTVYPSDVTNMSSNCSNNNSLFAIDRFWRIDAGSYTTKPTPIIDFGYDDAANELAGTNTINESRLQAERFNPNSGSWETPLKLYGTDNSALNTVSGVSISPADFYQSWTLIDTNSMYVTRNDTIVLCQGDSVFLQGAFQYTDGNYFDTIYVNGACDTSVVTNLSFTPTPTVANAGPNQSVCGTNATLAGNIAITGTGLWTLISGAGTITTPGSPGSGVTALGFGDNIFQWTISNGVCPPSISVDTITAFDTPTISVAGPAQTICDDSTSLSANIPTIGTGLWTLVSGSGTITTPTSPTTSVTALGVGANVFRWTISNGVCTPSDSTVVITRDAMPTTSIAGPNQSVCGTSATLAGNTATIGTGLWTLLSGSGTITTPSSSTSGVTALGVGLNVFEWTISNGTCPSSSSVDSVTNVQTPTISVAGPDQIVCNDSTILAGNTVTIGTGIWTLISGSGTITSPGSTNSSVTSLGFGANVFQWTIVNAPCPASSSNVTINVGGPTATISSQTNINCDSANTGSAVVVASGGAGSLSYLWTSGAGTNSTASNLAAGIYTVTVTDSLNCSTSASVTITQAAPITAQINSTPGCGLNNGSAEVTNVIGGNGNYTYSWSPSGGTNAIATGLSAGTYTCTITDSTNCSITKTDSVIVHQNPVAFASNDTTINYGSTANLQASGGTNYTWLPSADLSCDTCPNTEASPLQTTIYCVTVSDTNSCMDTACVTITVDNTCNIGIPTAFSPNGDGANDLECIRTNCATSVHLRIFNRWGEKIFETQNLNECWDGTYKGNMLNSAVFVYYLEAVLIDGTTVKQKGNITLIR